MNDPKAAAERIAETFSRIHREQMAGLPLLNEALAVETLGFQVYQGRVIGILITPWMMCLVILPGEGDHWEDIPLGHKQAHRFPSGTYKFMVNEVENVGRYQAYSLYSPMREFATQGQAVAAAEAFLEGLMTLSDHGAEVLADEELLGRIMRGEETPEIDMDELDSGRLVERDHSPAARLADIKVKVEETPISRRELLRGRLRES